MGQEGDDFRDMQKLYAERKAAAAPRPLPKQRKQVNMDRLLTEGEKRIWTRKTGGIKPGPNAKLWHFRRGMGGGGWSSQD